jgi:hypothetical protein
LRGRGGDIKETPPTIEPGRETMQLRHIRPGSADWNDAINEGREADLARLSPEEVKRLRALLEAEGLAKEEAETAPRQN